MKTIIRYAVAVGMLLSGASCAKENLFEDGGTRYKTFRLTQAGDCGESTRASVAGGVVNWEVGDALYYYTGKAGVLRGAKNKKYVVPEAGPTVPANFLVEYKDGDDAVVLYTKGSACGDVSNETMTSFKIADAIPAAQDGDFKSVNISAVKVGLDKDEAKLIPCQSIISFKLSSTTVGDKEVNYIELVGYGVDNYLTGDMTITPGETSVSVSSVKAGKKISIDKSASRFKPNQEYYVAVRVPAGVTGDPAYTGGIQIKLYNRKGSTDTYLGSILTKKNIAPAYGKILHLGTLNDHKHVPFRTLDFFPSFAYFSKDMPEGKKVWLKVYPSDFDGTVTWTMENNTQVGGANTMAITDLGLVTEEHVGKCYAVQVKPTAKLTDYGTYTANIVATVANKEGTASQKCTCKVEIGKWISMGGYNRELKKNVLWSIGRLNGTSMETNWYSVSTIDGTAWATCSNEATDPAKNLGDGCRTPSAEDWSVLSSKGNSDVSAAISSSSGYWYTRYDSKIKGYTDMYVILSAIGHGSAGAAPGHRWSLMCRSKAYTSVNASTGVSTDVGCWMRSGIVSSYEGMGKTAEDAFKDACLETNSTSQCIRAVKYIP